MENQNENNVIEINLLDLLSVFLEQWMKIGASIVLTAAIVLIYTAFIATEQYASTATFYVLSKSTSITSFSDIQIGSSLATDYMLVVGSRPVLDTVIEDLELDMDYEELSEKLSFNNPSDSRMLEITATDPDPQMAKKIADDVAEVASAYISKKMDQDAPSIIQYGYIEEEPVSPHVMRDTCAGAVIGAILACFLIFIHYILHDNIMTAEELERKVGLQVIGTIPWEEGTDELEKYSKHDKKKGRR